MNIAQIAQDGGNTNSPSNTPNNKGKHRKWCFTLNNYTEKEVENILLFFTQKKNTLYIIGKEIGEQKTPHLQGYVEFKNQITFSRFKKVCDRLHLEKARGTREQNKKYCSKQSILKTNLPLTRTERLLQSYDTVTWKNWQQTILDIIETEPNDRTINWVYDPNGNSGKSFLCKYLVMKYNAIIADGKKDNIFNQIKIWLDNHEDHEDPKLIILDVPRYNIEYINMGTVEQIKNGLIYSGKYEGGICIFKSPHIFIFTNSLPDYTTLSKDRWNIIKIT